MKNKVKIVIRLSFVALIIIGGWGCSTKKNTFSRRVFHNLTAHYNAYFNGDQAIKEGVKKIHDAHEDNFNEILPVFRLADEQASQSASPELDRAIDKATKVIRKHSMEFDGKEYNNWIDDAYLLMGQSQFYKREYLLSKRLFNYVISKYHNHDMVYDAMIWKAWVDVIRGNNDQALNILEEVRYYEDRGKLTKEGERLYPKILAQLYINEQNYKEAIKWLNKSVKASNAKDTKNRLRFIKAQLYQKQNKNRQATNTFKKVIQNNPSYELTFYSKIKIAQSYEGERDDDFDIRSELQEMLEDAKNKEYQDVIYYALSQIALEENNQQKGIDYLQKSVEKSSNNNRQKAQSALYLGEIYFDQRKYELSQAYYDSAMLVIPKDYPRYDSLKTRHNVLSDLVENLIKVEKQDSLQHVAQMPEEERDQFINKLIEDVREEKRQEKAEERRKQMAHSQAEANKSQNNNSGEWYFYNNQAKSFGFNEFRQKWGERKLEDNWRLSSKSSSDFGGQADSRLGQDSIADSLNGEPVSPDDKAYYLKDLPLTDSAMTLSDSIISEALFNLGLIYQEGLKDFPKAVESHEELIERYPESKYSARAYFHLYQNHKKLDNEAESEKYKNLILEKYPESDYAQFIKNPDYFKKQASQSDKAKNFYQKAWKAYSDGQYDQAKTLADTGMNRYSDSETAAQLALLKAFAQGKTGDSTAYVNALNQVVDDHQKTKPASKAKEILDALETEKKEISKEEAEKSGKTKKDTGLFTYEPDEMQLYVAIFKVENLSMNQVKVEYSDFNNEFHSRKKLSVNSVYLDSKHQMLTVSRFEDADQGLKYYRNVKSNQQLQNFLKNNGGQHFLLSVNDYSKFYKEKDVKKYKEFFEKNYLEK
ncbi:MAG: tetratricopeptide repeat protein [Bacteroidales bacterium]